jgi:hypothetical protein
MIDNPRKHPLLLAVTVACLTACGGGGGAGGIVEPEPEPHPCLALPQEITWHRDTQSSDWTDVLIDPRGRLWVAGWTGGLLGQSNIEPSGNSRPVLRVSNAQGVLLSDLGAQFDTPGTDTLEALAITATGTVFAAGRTGGSLDGHANAGQFDSFVAWSDDPTAARPWRLLQVGTPAPQHPRRLAVDEQGAVVLGGEDDDFVPSNYVDTWSDAFVLRWQRQQAGTVNDRLEPAWAWQASSPEPDLSGGLALMSAAAGGATFQTGSNLGGASGGAVLRKFDARGQLLWTARYSTSKLDHLAAVRVRADGSLLIAGSVFGSFRGGTAQGQQDVFIAQVDAGDGHVLRSWQFGSEASDWLVDMRLDGDGNVLLFGETSGRLAPGATPAGLTDLFLMRVAPDGRVLASRQWGTGGDERAGRLAVDQCGSVVAVGSSTADGHRDALTWFWPR